jgi:nucleotide-binding universal stress UspA family protein
LEIEAMKKIAIGFDGSEGSHRALKEAVHLAVLEQAQLFIVSIEELPRYPSTVGEVVEEQEYRDTQLHKLHEGAVEMATKAGLDLVNLKTEIKLGHPARGLIDYVVHIGADLLILGHSGHSAVWGTFVGTTAEKVMRHACCSVLVVR